MNIGLRKADRSDCAMILSFIKALAAFEKLEHEVVADEATLLENLFGDSPVAEVVFATVDDIEVGFVLFFKNFSTFLGKPGLYIEDLYVKEEFRGKGVGRALLNYISSLAMERGCERVEWWVLKWNPARKFYDNIGAKSMDDWVVYRLTGSKLKKLAENFTDSNDESPLNQ